MLQIYNKQFTTMYYFLRANDENFAVPPFVYFTKTLCFFVVTGQGTNSYVHGVIRKLWLKRNIEL